MGEEELGHYRNISENISSCVKLLIIPPLVSYIYSFISVQSDLQCILRVKTIYILSRILNTAAAAVHYFYEQSLFSARTKVASSPHFWSEIQDCFFDNNFFLCLKVGEASVLVISSGKRYHCCQSYQWPCCV